MRLVMRLGDLGKFHDNVCGFSGMPQTTLKPFKSFKIISDHQKKIYTSYSNKKIWDIES
jgi:hypothetical protein